MLVQNQIPEWQRLAYSQAPLGQRKKMRGWDQASPACPTRVVHSDTNCRQILHFLMFPENSSPEFTFVHYLIHSNAQEYSLTSPPHLCFEYPSYQSFPLLLTQYPLLHKFFAQDYSFLSVNFIQTSGSFRKQPPVEKQTLNLCYCSGEAKLCCVTNSIRTSVLNTTKVYFS